MRLGVSFTLLTAGLVFGAIQLGGWGLLLLAPAATFAACAVAYFGVGPAVFGKRRDGTRAWWGWLITGPYILVAWVIWRGLRFVRRENGCDPLLPDILMGRRLLPRELPGEVTVVVDLTAEMWEAAGVRRGRIYLARPILDGHVPTDDSVVVDLVREIDRQGGSVYFHCAEGRGRTGMVAAALLILRGEADNLTDALALGRERRPSLRLSRAQRALVERITPALRSPRVHPPRPAG